MNSPETPQQTVEEFNRRLEELSRDLATINQTIEEALSGNRKRQPALDFPFSFLDRLINAGLLGLERLVRRLVTAIVR